MEETKAFPAKENLTAGQKRESSKKETKKEGAVSPWEVLRAHPSAFLPTRLNKMMPWSFPMGKAVKEGRSYGGRKGHTSTWSHYSITVGNSNSIGHVDIHYKWSF